MEVRHVRDALLAYCRAPIRAGHESVRRAEQPPADGRADADARLPRLVLTQALKRSPIDIRRLLLVPETQNPKAIALFLGAALRMAEIPPATRNDLVRGFIDLLAALRSKGTDAWCWGYSFPWQTRTLVVPRSAPNLVCTTFVANALLDAYELTGDERCLTMAASAAEVHPRRALLD